MFSFINEFMRKRKVNKALALLSSPEGEIEFEPETIRVVFEAVSSVLDDSQDALSINGTLIQMHHEPYFLLEKLRVANMAIRNAEEFEHFSRLSNFGKKELRSWLVDDEKNRLDYYAFIKAITTLVQTNVEYLGDVKDRINKTRYRVYLDLLYTIHCDCLTLAELHLRKYG
ncbi:hypothetical protein TOTORO_02310 [Serratia phage vB_SmaS-Totoro]|nr:hypothetical protein TOTORO_02310 [Serratia phage vB_SmaS-Totoro]